jgi:hypothetical protein
MGVTVVSVIASPVVSRSQKLPYGFVQHFLLVELEDGPNAALPVDSVDRAPMAIGAEWYGGEPLPLLQFVRLTWAWRIADAAWHFLNPANMLALGLGHAGLVLAKHVMPP